MGWVGPWWNYWDWWWVLQSGSYIVGYKRGDQEELEVCVEVVGQGQGRDVEEIK